MGNSLGQESNARARRRHRRRQGQHHQRKVESDLGNRHPRDGCPRRCRYPAARILALLNLDGQRHSQTKVGQRKHQQDARKHKGVDAQPLAAMARLGSKLGRGADNVTEEHNLKHIGEKAGYDGAIRRRASQLVLVVAVRYVLLRQLNACRQDI